LPGHADSLSRLLLGRVYSIGILKGPSPLALAATGESNPVLTRDDVPDVLAVYVADPFMVRADGTWHMFFEILTWRPGAKKGEIALATSRDGERWEYRGIVLSEPFHLSYPNVFRCGSDHYMVPESASAGAVRLYRADPFPSRWSFVGDLIRGPGHVDSTVFEHDGSWWMFTETDTRRGTLRLFRSNEITGPWVEHPQSPVVASDLRVARPAGRVVTADGRLLRFAQDCRTAYGSSVSAIEIAELSPKHYRERDAGSGPLLAASGRGWNAEGMHQIDAHQLEDGSWIACVDGWSLRVRRPREVWRWAADRWSPRRTVVRKPSP
jgi:hypothetical protein